MTVVLFFKAARAKARPLDEDVERDEDVVDGDEGVGGEPAGDGRERGAPADGVPDKEGVDDNRPSGGDEQPGALGDGFGPHNVEEGHHVAFTAGAFKGRGKVAAAGEDGCTVCDETGREHRVHWHEVTGHHQTEAAE